MEAVDVGDSREVILVLEGHGVLATRCAFYIWINKKVISTLPCLCNK